MHARCNTSRNRRCASLLLGVASVTGMSVQGDNHRAQNATHQSDDASSGVWLQIKRLIRDFRCHSIFLDVGSNVGVQIRKLFEPSLYAGKDPHMPWLAKVFDLRREPTDAERDAGIVTGSLFWNTTALVLPVFDKYFGPAPRCGVCAIGIEPNPKHTARHAEMQAALRAAGMGVLWLSATAADVADGSTTLNLAGGGGMVVNDVGMRAEPVTSSKASRAVTDSIVRVATLDLAKMVLFVRSLLLPPPPRLDRSSGTPRSRLVMKIDTEGAEYALLPHLLERKAACAADLIFLEWHPSPPPHGTAHQRAVRNRTLDALRRCEPGTVVSTIDDETFLFDGKPLPTARLCGEPGEQ